MTEIDIHQKRWQILGVIVLSTFMATLDASIVNVALPVMAKKLGTEIHGIQWVVTSYLLIISSCILTFGKLSDRIGKSDVFLKGFLIFGLGSLFCSLSSSLLTLVVSRIIQAIGAAMFMSSNQGIIAAAFSQKGRGRALGLLGSTVAVGTMTGPPLGGFLVHFLNWQSIFIINIPISFIGFIVGLRILPKDKNNREKKAFDFAGSFLLISGVSLLFWAILSVNDNTMNTAAVYAAGVAGLIALALLIPVERRAKDPVIDTELFKIPFFNVSIFCAFITFVVVFIVNIIHPFYLQNGLNFTPAEAGLFMVAFPVATFIVAPVSGHISDTVGPRFLTVLGLIVLVAALLLFSTLNLDSSAAYIVGLGVMLGAGHGIFQSPNTSIIMGLSPKEKLGTTGSINAFARNMGMVSGIAFAVSLLYNRMSVEAGRTVEGFPYSNPQIFIDAMHFVYLAGAGLCVIGLVLTIYRILKK